MNVLTKTELWQAVMDKMKQESLSKAHDEKSSISQEVLDLTVDEDALVSHDIMENQASSINHELNEHVLDLTNDEETALTHDIMENKESLLSQKEIITDFLDLIDVEETMKDYEITEEFLDATIYDELIVVDEPRKSNQLDRFSLTGTSSKLELEVEKSEFILGNIALTGQATVIFAAPNTGKTLITLRLIMAAKKNLNIDLSKLYYLNLDDTGEGLVQKLKIAEEFGFQMLANGHNHFNSNDFTSIIIDMTNKRECLGVVIVVDTLKKITDMMNKQKSSDFNKLVRKFVSFGGTFIGLAHVNKQLGANGKPIYAGTSDIVDDFDCGIVLHKCREDDDFHYVQFENIKSRGNVAQLATYKYSNEKDLSYNELLISVEHVDVVNEQPFYMQLSETNMIEEIKSLIEEGVNTKMILADVAAKKLNVSKRKILKFIETNIGLHWDFTVGNRNANIFFVIDK